MAEEIKIQKKGNSLLVTLPKQVCDMLGWCHEHKVRIKIGDGGNLIVINKDLGKDEKNKDFFR